MMSKPAFSSARTNSRAPALRSRALRKFGSAFSMMGVDRKRSLSRESRLLARLQRDGDERGTAEHHVDPDEQAERPEERPWQAGDDETREDQIDDTVYQNPLPFARQLTAMGDGEDDHQNT